jgi:hypothetical protein
MGWDEWRRLRKAFASYLLDEDRRHIAVPTLETYRGQRELREKFAKEWGVD